MVSSFCLCRVTYVRGLQGYFDAAGVVCVVRSVMACAVLVITLLACDADQSEVCAGERGRLRRAQEIATGGHRDFADPIFKYSQEFWI